MTRWAMAIDLAACTGCGACVVACRQENNLPSTGNDTANLGRQLDWIRIVTDLKGDYQTLSAQQYPLMCMHCDDPPCTKVCPVQATYRDEEGIVAQIYARCIGCRYCTNACPYAVKTFNWFGQKWPDGTARRQNPDVSVRPVGVVEKCTFCHHRRQKAKENARMQGRAMEPGEYQTACVEVCPTSAMIFGDLDDPNSRVSQMSSDSRAQKLMDELGTMPKVFYLHRHGDTT